jgi:glycosyltransferase involved in cell wall biosynthesis
MNILLVVPWDQESGGVAAVVGHLARYLEAEGQRVLFLFPGPNQFVRQKKTKWGFPGMEVRLRTPFNPDHPLRSVVSFIVMFPFTLWQLVRLLRANDIRVVNIHYPGEHFIYFAVCRRLLPIRLVVSIHGCDVIAWEAPSTATSRSLAFIFRAADLIVAPSWRFLRRCDEIFAPFSARRLAIHNGTDLAELETREATADRIQVPFILSACSLDRYKGLDVLIRAIAILRDAGDTTRLIVAGEGPVREELEKLIADLALQQQVQLIGQQSRASVVKLLHQSTCFVLPSRFENFPIAVLEAMA